MPLTLTERLRAHEQQKAPAGRESSQAQGAYAPNDRSGWPIEKAGLLDLDPNALYGGLLSLRDGGGDKSQIDQWSALGRAFAREVCPRDEGKEAIVLAFPAALRSPATSPRIKKRAARRIVPVVETSDGNAPNKSRPSSPQGLHWHEANGGCPVAMEGLKAGV